MPEIKKERGNAEFMVDSIKVSNQVIENLKFLCELKPAFNIENEFYIVIMGHIVRLYKVYDTLICLVVHKGLEVSSIMNRCIIETVTNLDYILDNNSPENLLLFQQNSLKK